jgi:flagellar basal-body rod protein FlgB
MSGPIGGVFNFSDRLQMESLNQRLTRSKVITANIANSETPGFRAIGYNFEQQLQAVAGSNDAIAMKTSNPMHLKNSYTRADGKVFPDVFVRPTESVPHDGNTVDVDKEMSELASNQILYQTAIDLLNRKIGVIKYAISSGGGR